MALVLEDVERECGVVRRELAARITFQCVPEIVCAALGDEAAVLGAALIAFDLMGRS